MEHIREALTKAKVALDDEHVDLGGGLPPGSRSPRPLGPGVNGFAEPVAPASATATWRPRQFELDAKLMIKNRIVSHGMSDPSHAVFNLLRTRVRKILQDNKWKSVAITSPTPGCGKSMVSLNLAFSFARGPGCRTVLIDLDLKKPAIAQTLGIVPRGSIGSFLKGRGTAEDCFVELNRNLVVGLNADSMADSSELIHSTQMRKLIEFVNTALAPDVLLFDLPPMKTCDDALAILPFVDAALLVAAEGMSTLPDIDECEQQISHHDKFMGVVLNKSNSGIEKSYYEY